ncbi:hypothetical protein OG417_46315 [Actinoallomurus sp. NBC_01490]|uniref:hypothetical protein n=1 Tax=Actinoallomurus sp. NBC_01490 TaxID=2903557 RepID=UPI002E2FCD76|nr:hypothetical protein [Actinoallomurus sp. NBC_01490]
MPEWSRRTASMPYGRSAGFYTKTTPRADSSSYALRKSAVSNEHALADQLLDLLGGALVAGRRRTRRTAR